MTPESSPVCDQCGAIATSVSTRRGRGELALCDKCDEVTAQKMCSVDILVPNETLLSPGDVHSTLPLTRPFNAESCEANLCKAMASVLSTVDIIDGDDIEALSQAGYRTVGEVWYVGVRGLVKIDGLEPSRAVSIIDALTEGREPKLDSTSDKSDDDSLGSLFSE